MRKIINKNGILTLVVILFVRPDFSIAQSNPKIDSVARMATIEHELSKLRAEVSNIQLREQNAGNEITNSARLQFSSFKTSIIGSVIGGAALIATGNIALSGAIFSATFLVSLGQNLSAIAKTKRAGEILNSQQFQGSAEVVANNDNPGNSDPFAFEYASEYLFHSEGSYVYSHNSLQREVEFGVNGPFVYEEVQFLLKNHSDFKYASMPTIAQLQLLLNSDTKLFKKLYKNSLVVWSSDFGKEGNMLCLNFRTGEVEEHSVESQKYFVPIVKLDKLIE
ncbi:MAG: hypothetical protein RL285_92 [Bacteroidota bacterium]|jgi:hypothetical protein